MEKKYSEMIILCVNKVINTVTLNKLFIVQNRFYILKIKNKSIKATIKRKSQDILLKGIIQCRMNSVISLQW